MTAVLLNRGAIALSDDLPICEWSPTYERMAKLEDAYHGRGRFVYESARWGRLSVCGACLKLLQAAAAPRPEDCGGS